MADMIDIMLWRLLKVVGILFVVLFCYLMILIFKHRMWDPMMEAEEARKAQEASYIPLDDTRPVDIVWWTHKPRQLDTVDTDWPPDERRSPANRDHDGDPNAQEQQVYSRSWTKLIEKREDGYVAFQVPSLKTGAAITCRVWPSSSDAKYHTDGLLINPVDVVHHGQGFPVRYVHQSWIFVETQPAPYNWGPSFSGLLSGVFNFTFTPSPRFHFTHVPFPVSILKIFEPMPIPLNQRFPAVLHYDNECSVHKVAFILELNTHIPVHSFSTCPELQHLRPTPDAIHQMNVVRTYKVLSEASQSSDVQKDENGFPVFPEPPIPSEFDWDDPVSQQLASHYRFLLILPFDFFCPMYLPHYYWLTLQWGVLPIIYTPTAPSSSLALYEPVHNFVVGFSDFFSAPSLALQLNLMTTSQLAERFRWKGLGNDHQLHTTLNALFYETWMFAAYGPRSGYPLLCQLLHYIRSSSHVGAVPHPACHYSHVPSSSPPIHDLFRATMEHITKARWHPVFGSAYDSDSPVVSY